MSEFIDLARAVEFVNAGAGQPAVIHAQRHLASHPDDPSGYVALALALELTGADNALETARRAVALAPDFPQGWLTLSQMLHRAGKDRDAEDAASRAIQLQPNVWQCHQALAQALPSWANERAIREAKEAVRLAPDLPGPHITLGEVYDEGGRTEQARLEFEAALRLDPSRLDARHDLALAEMGQNRLREATTLARGVLRDRPDLRQARAPFMAAELWLIKALCLWGVATSLAYGVIQGVWLAPSADPSVFIPVAVAAVVVAALAGVAVVFRKNTSLPDTRAVVRLMGQTRLSRVLYPLFVVMPLALVVMAVFWHSMAAFVITALYFVGFLWVATSLILPKWLAAIQAPLPKP